MFKRNYVLIAAGLGLLGGLTRYFLYRLAADTPLLLQTGHPLEAISYLLTLAAAAFCLAAAWKQQKSQRFSENFSPSFPALCGHVFAAAGIFLTVFGNEPGTPGVFAVIWRVLGYGSIPCLVLAGYFRMQGKQPHFGLHLVPCLFLLLHIVVSFRGWSGFPEPQGYLFALLGSISMTFFSYDLTAFDVDIGKRRRFLFFALAAVYLGLTEAVHSDAPWLYLCCAIWAAASLWDLRALPEAPREPQV